MTTPRVLSLVVASVLLAIGHDLSARDGVRLVSESKVEAAKAKIREADMSDWMTDEELKKLGAEKRAKGEQLIYFEYHVGKDKWRGKFTKKIQFRGFSWWCFYGKNEAEEKIDAEQASGKQAAFIVRSGATYAMLFVNPEQYSETRKLLDELGIGAPKLR